jgi:ferric-dicitrate binding protein FerR (iron transport regulator)
MTEDDKRVQIEEHLSEILDGDAPGELYDLIAESDDLRDLRYDAERAAELARDAGADYEPPAELEARVLAAVDASPADHAADGSPAAPVEPAPAVLPAPDPVPNTVTDPTSTAAAPTPSPELPAPPKVTPLWTSKHLLWAGGGLLGGLGLLGLAAAASFMLWWGKGALYPKAGTTGTVARVSSGEKSGLELCNARGQRCSRLSQGGHLAGGSMVKTDARTRAELRLEDGTELVLDRMTRLVLSENRRREVRLESGMMVADVARDPKQPARFEVPVGAVEVLGTKFSLRAGSDWASVDVSRGQVRLTDEQQRSVTVRAGEEGRVERGAAPYAVNTAVLGESFAWSETASAESEPEVTTRGLGELKAKKPGEQQERERAVTLTSHTVKVRIAGSMARTEVDEVFSNHTSEVLEGIYRFPLPPDAKIERLALEVDGKLEEGAFVDRERAAAIWRGAIVNAAPQTKPQVREEIIWVPGPWRDPALLEWQRGGRFELRIYPIPKNGSRRVVLAYTQSLQPTGGVRRYTYPLAYDPSGSTRVGDFRLDLELRGHDARFGVRPRGYELVRGEASAALEKLSYAAKEFVPSGDLSLEYRLPDSGSELTLWAYQPAANPASGPGAPDAAAYVALALRPKLPRAESTERRAYVLVVDSSRSMFGESYQRALQVTSRIVRELGDEDKFTVLACDTSCRALPGGLRAPGVDGAQATRQFLGGIVPEGASDLAHAIRSATTVSGLGADRALRVVYVGDGTPTVGPVRPAYLTRAVESALGRGRGMVIAVAVGADSDLDSLRAVARGGGGVVLPFTPGQTAAEAAYAVLGSSLGQALRDVKVRLPDGLGEVAPEQVDTIAAGSESIVVARLLRPEVSGMAVLSGKVGEKPFLQRYPVEVRPSSSSGNAFVPRLYAATRIADLEQKTDRESKEQALSLSTRFNVASRYTSLLVLESEAMIKAFGLTNQRTAPVYTGEETAEQTDAVGEVVMDEDDRKLAGGGMLRPGAASSGLGDIGLVGRASATSDPRLVRTAKAEESEAPKERAAAPAPAKKAQSWICAPGDPSCAQTVRAPSPPLATVAPQTAPPPWGEPPDRLRRWIPMRRVWQRIGEISTSLAVPKAASADAIAAAERDLAQNDQRRSAVRKLYTLYALSGDLERARSLADRWSEKEPLDPDALTARADMAARMGDREGAIRILGSVVDVRPGDIKAQQRLARLHSWANRPAVGCRHRIALAQLVSKDPEVLAEGVRCARETGEGELVEDLLTAAEARIRSRAEQLLLQVPKDTGLSGDLRLEATWSSGSDLDLALLDPEGNRISWLGAPTRAVISATSVTSTSSEGLSLRGAKPGEYVIEIVRVLGSGPVNGQLKITVGSNTRTVPFNLDGSRITVGLATVRMEPRLVEIR